LSHDPRFKTLELRRGHASELAAILDPIFATHPWPEWRKRPRHHEITFGLLGVVRDVPHDEQAVANGAIVPSTVPEMPRTISAPIRLSFAPVTVAPGPGPAHGQHTEEVLVELGYNTRESAGCAKRARWADSWHKEAGVTGGVRVGTRIGRAEAARRPRRCIGGAGPAVAGRGPTRPAPRCRPGELG
jgi:hypothetical protein